MRPVRLFILKSTLTVSLTLSLSLALASTPLSPAAGILHAQAAKPGAKPAAGAAKPAGRVVELEAGDSMKYSLTQIDAKPGEALTVRVKATGAMPRVAMAHNFVLLKAGADPVAFTNAGATAMATDFIAPTVQTQVLASTKLAGNGETVEVSFKAPTKPGSYTYLCTFPGHFVSGMKGVLVVK
jgi:azurin